MPRPNRPQYHAPRHCWKTTVGGRTRYYGKGIPPNEKPQMDGIPTRAWEAMNALIEQDQARTDPAPVAADGTTLTVEALTDRYMEWARGRVKDGKLSPEHFASKEHHMGLFHGWLLHAHAGGSQRRAGTLEPADIEAFLERMGRKYAPHYVANIGASVAALFAWAKRNKVLADNPISGFATPSVPRSPERFAERAEAAALLRFWRGLANRYAPGSAGRRFARLTLLLERCLINLGPRPGELCRLQWKDIKWAGGTSSAGHDFAKAVLPPERHKTGAKTGKPRTLFLTPLLTRALRREFEKPDRHPTHVFVHGRGQGGKGAGEPWASGSRLSKVILRVRRLAIAECARRTEEGEPTRGLELIRDEGPNKATHYRFRHTAASNLLMMGVDVPTVAELLGTGPDLIYKTYGHLLDDHLTRAAEALGQARRRGRPGS